MQITNIKYIPEFQRIGNDIVTMIIPCFYENCKGRATMRTTIMDDDGHKIQPSLCGRCAARPVEELAEYFFTRWEG